MATVWAYHAVIIFLVLIMFVLTTNGGIGSTLSCSLSLNLFVYLCCLCWVWQRVLIIVSSFVQQRKGCFWKIANFKPKLNSHTSVTSTSRCIFQNKLLAVICISLKLCPCPPTKRLKNTFEVYQSNCLFQKACCI